VIWITASSYSGLLMARGAAPQKSTFSIGLLALSDAGPVVGAERRGGQHKFWDRFVRHAQELRQRLDYIHLNPVGKGLVKRPEQRPWVQL